VNGYNHGGAGYDVERWRTQRLAEKLSLNLTGAFFALGLILICEAAFLACVIYFRIPVRWPRYYCTFGMIVIGFLFQVFCAARYGGTWL